MKKKSSINYEEILRYSQIPNRFRGVSLHCVPKQNLKHYKVVGKIVKEIPLFIKNGTSLYLWGEYSNGKTSASIIIAKKFIELHKTVLFISANELVNVVVTNKDFSFEQSYYDRIGKVGLLIIDDLGIEYSKEFGKSLVEKIIRMRSGMKRNTIITSNLNPNQLEEVYGTGLREVMKESFVRIKFVGYDWRKNILKKTVEHLLEEKDD